MEGISGALYGAAEKVAAAAAQAWTTVVEWSGHLWTWLGTNIPAAFDTMCSAVMAAWNIGCAYILTAWHAAGPALNHFASWVATNQLEVAAVAAIAILGTLATRAICNRLP